MCKSYAEVAMEIIRNDWKLRKDNGKLDQDQIARILRVNKAVLERTVIGRKDPTISFVCAYATAVGMPMDELLNAIGQKEVEEQRTMLIASQYRSSEAEYV